MPLFDAEPKIDQYRKCVNQFWRKTAEQGAGTTAFVQIESDYGVMSYLSCLKLLKQNEVDVYLKISLGLGENSESAQKLAEDYHGTYSALIAGFYIAETPKDSDSEVVQALISKVKSLDEKYKGMFDL